MYTKIHWLHRSDNTARLGIMARPRAGEWLEGEMVQLKKQNVSIVVSLLEPAEISELGLQAEKTTCESMGSTYINFPIADRKVPLNIDKARALVDHLTQQHQNGATIVIHCRMGIGRSSIIAGCVLLQLGYPPGSLIAHISNMRGLKVPDTDEQTKWLLQWKPSNK